MIDPYELSQLLTFSPSMASFFEDDIVIKVYLEGGWVMKGRNSKGLIMIHPTEYGTIMFSLPVSDVPPDRMLMSMVAQIDAMNGTLNLVPDEEGEFLLMYTAYIPSDFNDFEEHGQIIRNEVRAIRSRLNQIMSIIEDGQSTSDGSKDGPGFSADSFNKMMKEIMDRGKSKKPKPEDTVDDEEKE